MERMQMKDRKGRILIVDDDADLAAIIRVMLENYGYIVSIAQNCECAFTMLTDSKYELILLDINLPDGTGFEVCEELRKVSDVPVIFASARSGEDDKICGLDMGADDYLAKPYSLKELLSRVNALMRRTYGKREQEMVYHIGDNINVQPAKRMVTRDGVEVKLALKEFDLLYFLCRNPNRAISKDEILREVWGAFSETESATVSVHIRWLREKLERNPAQPELLKTVWGTGYQLIMEAAPKSV